MRIFGDDTRAALEFDAYEAGVRELAWIVEDGALQRALWSGLAGMALRCERLEIAAEHAVLSFADGAQLAAKLVVGADGAHSFVRQAAGMLGIFLVGIFSRRTGNHAAMIAAAIGVLVIAWMTLSPKMPATLGALKNPFDKNMVIVIGTLSIFLVGVLLNGPKARRPKDNY